MQPLAGYCVVLLVFQLHLVGLTLCVLCLAFLALPGEILDMRGQSSFIFTAVEK